MLVVSDTSPICYLLLIGEIDLLPRLYHQISIPQVVQQELADDRSPTVVKNWINAPPDWLIVQNITVSEFDRNLQNLDAGEIAAILLAERVKADLLVIDDALGRKIARERGLRVTGLLGILDEAANRGLIDLPDAIARLKTTTFRASSSLLDSLAKRYLS